MMARSTSRRSPCRDASGARRARGTLIRIAPAAAIGLSLLLGGCTGPAAPRLALARDAAGSPDAFEARGLDARYLASPAAADVDWRGILEVFVDGATDGPAERGADGLPPILGSARIDRGVLRFVPRFPLEPGLRYRARLRPGPWIGRAEGEGAAVEAVFALPPRSLEPRTLVERVYPSADALPENQLKFYIHFSRPMRRGQAYGKVRLVDLVSGQEVEAPFLELGEELWDPSGTRFTLFFDPGRVKRGILPHEELGPALRAGRRYALEIDRGWLDAEGAPLREPHRKEFAVVEPDYAPPDPLRWKVSPPAAGSGEPLAVAFPEPLDHALLNRLLRVRGPGRAVLAGEIEVAAGERAWRFRPRSAWTPGRHELLIDNVLEDLAGNSIGRPFEVDVARGIESRIAPEIIAIPFEIAPPDAGR